MATQFVQIDLSRRFGPKIRRLSENLRNVRADMAELKAVADQAAFSSDWLAFERAFGVPSGEGETVYNLLSGAHAHLESAGASALNSFADRIG